jgi:hypothetical protein
LSRHGERRQDVRILDRGTIFDATAAPPEERFCTCPSLVRLPSGRFVASLRAGSSKDAADEDTPVLVSDDNAAICRRGGAAAA